MKIWAVCLPCRLHASQSVRPKVDALNDRDLKAMDTLNRFTEETDFLQVGETDESNAFHSPCCDLINEWILKRALDS